MHHDHADTSLNMLHAAIHFHSLAATLTSR